MFYGRKTLNCPVCKDYLGYLVAAEVCSFVCRECRFIFSWDRNGVLMPPVRLDEKKPKICTCGGCQMRDSKI
jgi:transposase-like protein